MHTKFIAGAIGISLLLVGMNACQLDQFKEIEGIEFQAEYAVPLINAALTIQDVLDRSDDDLSFLTIEADGSMTLSFEEKARGFKGDELLGNTTDPFQLPVFTNVQKIPLAFLQNVSLQQADFKSGELRFSLTSSLPEDLDVTITIPEILANNQPLTFSATLNYSGNSPVTSNTSTINLSDYTLQSNSGELTIQYEAMNGSGQNRTIDQVMGYANDWAFDFISGNWAEQVFPAGNDNLSFDIFDNQVDGELNFADPRLNIVIHNSIGIPMIARVKKLEVLTSENQWIDLESPELAAGILVNSPSLNQMGQSIESTFVIDRNNSNIDEIFNAQPRQVHYEVELVLAGSTGNNSGFITADGQVDMDLKFELPVYGTAKDLTFENVVDIDFGEDLDQVEKAQFKLITENELPVDVNLQCYFLNANGNRTDSMFVQPKMIIESNAPAVTTFIDLTPARLEKLRHSTQLLLRSQMSTSDHGATQVRILADQELKVKLGLRATIAQ